MLLKRFYDEQLAQASWLIGCAATGGAVVVDPNRDAEQYLAAAEAEGLRITHVTETHIHADFVSGARELAQRTGATLYLSAEGGPDWLYGFAEQDNAVLLHDGDHFMVGNVRLDILHTPGHTPEHISFVVTDTAGADEPMGIFTGDFVFVGDVGRPDLLEKAAGVTGTMVAGARALFHSIERFRQLPDYLQVWPGHGAGSACGKALGAVPQSTVGYEKLFNPALAFTAEDDFVEWVLAGQPEPPRYFAEMKRINRDGPRILGTMHAPPRLDASQLPALLESGAHVIDSRSAAEYARAHVPGTISIPLNRSFTTWAGWLTRYDQDFYIICSDDAAAENAARDLAMIGLDRLAGYFGAEAVAAWEAQGRTAARVPHTDVDELRDRMQQGTATVLDVRGATEYEAGHIPGTLNIPLGYLEERLDDVPRGNDLIVHCQTGARSAIAVSLLERKGFKDVSNLNGGFVAWQRAGMPTA
jgi:hydroxyacylglutathione hydrolase